jgi:16S rRNA (adenine1518-N6/adenine1519-N6)-dimethyltransferase
VHAFEVDRSLEKALQTTLRDDPNVSLYFEDVLKASLERLDPVPTLCASNLPYSVAGPFLIESLQRLPTVRRYCVMVQREVAERMAAAPGSKNYGVLSVWVGLYAEIAHVRPLSRSIFHPRPNVDSSLIVLERLAGDRLESLESAWLRVIVQAAFGQRRKTLVNSLAAGLGLPRERVLALVTDLGLPADIRAERLAPARFVELARPLSGKCRKRRAECRMKQSFQALMCQPCPHRRSSLLF